MSNKNPSTFPYGKGAQEQRQMTMYGVSYCHDYLGWEIFAGEHVEDLGYDQSFLLVLGPFCWLWED